MTTTNYNDIVPKGVLFNLAEIQDMNLIKKSMARKIVDQGLIEFVKIGNKIHISRAELIRYLEDQTVPKTA